MRQFWFVFQSIMKWLKELLPKRLTKLLACEAGVSILSLRSRRKHKAWGASPRSIFKKRFEPVKTGGSVNVSGFRPLSRALELDAIGTWGLRPRLYAYACFAG